MNRCFALQQWLLTLDQDEPQRVKDSGGHNKRDRTYQYMPQVTNYMFCLGGTLRTNRVTKTRYLSLAVLFVIIVPCVLFSIFEAPFNIEDGLKTFVVLFYFFWLQALASFIAAATMDPGILPKNIHSPFGHKITETKDTNATISPSNNLPQEYYNIITLPCQNNQGDKSTIDIKYCKTCKIWRPPRSYHCSTCQCCISVHDHHCIWVNNCIGQRNYRFFLNFLISSVMTSIILIICSSIHIHRNYQNARNLPPVSIVLIIYSGLTIWYPLLLYIYHLLMTSTQQTTREYLKHLTGIKNPIMHPRVKRLRTNNYDFGSRLTNCWELMAQVRGPNMWSPRSHINANDIRVQR